MSANWKLTLAYDGSDFNGWQVQPGLPTVQGTLAEAIARICGENVLPQGSGRTDTGVHALGQVASFTLNAPIPAQNLMRALNRTLPPALRVVAAEIAPEDFHARHSAQSKWYEYRIYRGEVCPPSLCRYVYALNWPLNQDAMQQAALALVGEHDFTSFAASDPDRTARASHGTDRLVPNEQEPRVEEQKQEPDEPSNIRILFSSDWSFDADHWTYRVHGSGFLHHMVRNLVGTLLSVGRGQFAPDQMPALLAARNRAATGATAPARGLFLAKVIY